MLVVMDPTKGPALGGKLKQEEEIIEPGRSKDSYVSPLYRPNFYWMSWGTLLVQIIFYIYLFIYVETDTEYGSELLGSVIAFNIYQVVHLFLYNSYLMNEMTYKMLWAWDIFGIIGSALLVYIIALTGRQYTVVRDSND